MYRLQTGFTVADAMTRDPVTITPSKTLRDASKLMTKEHVGALLVKDGSSIVGILTEQDIVRKAVSQGGNCSEKKVNEIMAESLVSTSPSEDIFEALRIMRDYNIRHLPVYAEGQFAGLITMKDILRVEPDLFEILVEKIELREIERKPVKKYKLSER